MEKERITIKFPSGEIMSTEIAVGEWRSVEMDNGEIFLLSLEAEDKTREPK